MYLFTFYSNVLWEGEETLTSNSPAWSVGLLNIGKHDEN